MAPIMSKPSYYNLKITKMNIKNIIILTSFLSMNNLLIKCAEMEQKANQEKKLSNYEKLLSFFPDVEPALKKYEITKENINNAPRLTISSGAALFRIYGNLVSIEPDKLCETGYKIDITIRK